MPSPDLPALPDLPPVAHQGERVLTTELLARVYGVEEKVVHDNHQNNRDRFAEGVHFHRLTGDALRTFKSYPDHIGVADKFARQLVLWTERGAARHAKLISTDEAWNVFGRLEESYFDGHVAVDTPESHRSRLELAREATETFALWHEFVATTIGFDRNQAMIAANRAARRAVGIDVLEEIGHTALPAPHQQTEMIVSDLGHRLGGLTAKATNLLLTKHGFQNRLTDVKNRIFYEPTDLGRPHSRLMDVDTKNRGRSQQQLVWFPTVVDPLKAAMAQGEVS